MRQLILESWMTLDGYAADRNGELGFFPSTAQSRKADEKQLRFLEGVDTMLLGRKTFEMFNGYWPEKTSKDEIVADKLNSLKRVVVSSTLKNPNWGQDGRVKLIDGNLEAAIKDLKASPGKDIVLWGSISLAQTLLTAGLIDRVRLNICPAIIGGGRRQFADAEDWKRLKLLGSRGYGSGVVWAEYSVGNGA